MNYRMLHATVVEVGVATLDLAVPASSGFKIEVIVPSTGLLPIELHVNNLTHRKSIFIKGALDKYNIYHFIYSSIEDLKSNQYWKFQLILPKRFHFMGYFVNSIIFRVPHSVLCIYCSRIWKVENARNIHISSKESQSRM